MWYRINLLIEEFQSLNLLQTNLMIRINKKTKQRFFMNLLSGQRSSLKIITINIVLYI